MMKLIKDLGMIQVSEKIWDMLGLISIPTVHSQKKNKLKYMKSIIRGVS